MLNPKENNEIESSVSEPEAATAGTEIDLNEDEKDGLCADGESRLSARRIIVDDKKGAIGSKSGGKSVIRKIAAVVLIVLAAAAAAMLIKTFVISPMLVDGVSMQPYLQDKDVIVVLKCGYKLDYQDVIVFDRIDAETDTEKHPVKRIIGKSGDFLEFKFGNVYRNGELLDESAYHIEKGTTPPGNFISYTVPENCLFVLGDHRSISKDSRVYGAISIDQVIGKVIATY